MSSERAECVVVGISDLWTFDADRQAPHGRLHDAAVAFRHGCVSWVGPSSEAPEADRVVDGRGTIALPGLVDCHTHSLFAGSRADEFARRLAGATYAEILEAGGGILSTVRATRAASDDELAATLTARLDDMLTRGVTTVEVKTGYGLHPDHELRHLRVIAGVDAGPRVVPTFLGAHAVPLEWRDDREAYLDLLVDQMIPAAAALGAAVDVYCDRGAYTLDEARRVLEAGRAHGAVIKAHAEQIEHTGVAALAAELGAASADHLERIDEAGIAAMAEAGTVAVLLPGARTYLHDPSPPVPALREAGVPLAVATDFNPGSSPVRDLLACATLACLDMGLTIPEALAGITVNAAKALARPELGWIGPGSAGDLALFHPPPGEPARAESLVQYLGGHRAHHVLRAGRVVHG